MLIESAQPAGFDIKHLKSIKTLQGEIAYARKFLTSLGVGSSRVVFAAGPSSVVKIARSSAGVAQNKEEIKIWKQERSPFLAAVVNYDPHGMWLEMERALPLDLNKYKQSTGFSFGDFQKTMWNTLLGMKITTPKVLKSPLFQTIDKMADDHELKVGDLIKPDSWGLAKRGPKVMPVLYDYGFTANVADKYYSKPN